MRGRIISLPQAVVILAICQLFHAFLFSPLTYQQNASVLFYGSIVGMLLTVLLLLPALFYYHKYPDGAVLEDSLLHLPLFGKGSLIACLFLFIGVLLLTAVRFSFFITVAIFPNASVLLTLILFFIAVAYGASMGIEGIVRAATILAVLLLAIMLLVHFGLLSYYNPVLLELPYEQSFIDILDTAWQQVSNNVTLVLAILLAPHIKQSFTKMIGWFVLVAGILTVLIFLSIVLVYGDFLVQQTFPYYSLSTIANTTLIQRMELLQMTLWVVVSYLRMAIYLVMGVEILKLLLPPKMHKGAFWGLVGFLFLVSVWLMEQVEGKPVSYDQIGTDLVLLFLLIVLPTVVHLKRRKGHETSKPIFDPVRDLD